MSTIPFTKEIRKKLILAIDECKLFPELFISHVIADYITDFNHPINIGELESTCIINPDSSIYSEISWLFILSGIKYIERGIEYKIFCKDGYLWLDVSCPSDEKFLPIKNMISKEVQSVIKAWFLDKIIVIRTSQTFGAEDYYLVDIDNKFNITGPMKLKETLEMGQTFYEEEKNTSMIRRFSVLNALLNDSRVAKIKDRFQLLPLIKRIIIGRVFTYSDFGVFYLQEGQIFYTSNDGTVKNIVANVNLPIRHIKYYVNTLIYVYLVKVEGDSVKSREVSINPDWEHVIGSIPLFFDEETGRYFSKERYQQGYEIIDDQPDTEDEYSKGAPRG